MEVLQHRRSGEHLEQLLSRARPEDSDWITSGREAEMGQSREGVSGHPEQQRVEVQAQRPQRGDFFGEDRPAERRLVYEGEPCSQGEIL